MIRNFKHNGLKQLYERGNRKRIQPDMQERVEAILAQLDVAVSVEALRLQSYHLHALKGDRSGLWSITVRANWRIVFRMEGENVFDVDLIDYH